MGERAAARSARPDSSWEEDDNARITREITGRSAPPTLFRRIKVPARRSFLALGLWVGHHGDVMRDVRIGFFFNHDQVHQIAHSLPIALSLMQMPGTTVVIATTNDRLSDEVRRLARRAGLIVPVIQLGLRRASSRFCAKRLEGLVPAAKLCIYRDNLDFFRTLDALVVTEKTSLLLKSRYGLEHLKIIHTRHGAGDRAIGFSKVSQQFDHTLVSGQKIRERLVREAGVSPHRLSVVGYPKFDLIDEAGDAPLFADPSKPTVLYNPHPSPHLSSWYRHGQAVLEHFLRDDRFNLIFAPHVMLFHRSLVVTIDKFRVDRPGKIDARFRDAPNIHIDTGSNALSDMTYTGAADIYLGDVSSQVYEFLHTPRPCIFLNSHGVVWRGDSNYLHWQAGDVIESPDALGAVLARAEASHHRYRPAQRELFERTFDLTAEPSSGRAARAIMSVLAPAPAIPITLPSRLIEAA
jgi:hypothetical protein